MRLSCIKLRRNLFLLFSIEYHIRYSFNFSLQTGQVVELVSRQQCHLSEPRGPSRLRPRPRPPTADHRHRQEGPA